MNATLARPHVPAYSCFRAYHDVLPTKAFLQPDHCTNPHWCSPHSASCAHHAGSTGTSLWTHYAAGEREYCGLAFPDGMRKNDRLARNVVTPTTKAADHDAPVSPAQIVERGLMSQADWDTVRILTLCETLPVTESLAACTSAKTRWHGNSSNDS